MEKARRAANLTQRELGAIGGVSDVAILRYENKARRLPVETAKKIAPFLGVNWWELYEDETEESNE